MQISSHVIFCTTTLVVLLWSTAYAISVEQPPSFEIRKTSLLEDRKSIYTAADQGITTLSLIAGRPNFKQEPTFRAYGFDSPEQVSLLNLDRPLQVMLVPYDQFSNYQLGTDPNSLLVPLHEVVFPVISQGVVRTSMSVSFSQTHNRWKATGWGKPKLIRSLVELKQYRASQTSFLVRIPSVNMHFLGDFVRGQLVLTPIFDNPRYGFIAGQSWEAEKAFQILQSAIRPTVDLNKLNDRFLPNERNLSNENHP